MRRSTLVPAALLLTLAACGGGDSGSPAASNTPGSSAPATTAAPRGTPVTLAGTVNDKGSVDLAAGTTADLDLADFAFTPTFLRAKGGSTITVRLKNTGAAPHTFTTANGTDATVAPGASGTATVTLPATGALAFWCKFHLAQGMQGAFYDQPGATASAGAAAGASASASGDDGGAYGQ